MSFKPRVLLVLYDSESPSKLGQWDSLNYPRERLDIVCVGSNADIKSHPNYPVYPDFASIESQKQNYDYIALVTGAFKLVHPQILSELVVLRKNAVAPLLVKRGTVWSNFWGALNNSLYYKRSPDYLDIVHRVKVGCFRVPYISTFVLISSKHFTADLFTRNLDRGSGKDMAFCYNLRDRGIDMYVCNQVFSHLNAEQVHLNDYDSRPKEWASRYIMSSFKLDHLGDDVYWSHLFTEDFCRDVLKAMQDHGWSSGSTGDQEYDKRIGAVENHPTVDIHLKDVGLEDMWQHVLSQYIAPMVSEEFKYKTKGTNITFVVKYSMGGQRKLRPHHDASTYTVNVCLNNDFRGGGCRFLRSGRIVKNRTIGSMVLHPGRLTHYHEGLPLEAGTRYILVSFIL